MTTPLATTPQQPIGSGLGAATTADEVLDGLDLTGRLAVVTGGYSGIGIEATRALTEAGAHVVVAARRPDVAREALDGVAGTEVDELDLGDLERVHAFADRFLASGRTFDMVIDSAAIMACPETLVGPGWEAQFGHEPHLGHFALVNRLWPALAPGGARVVSVSSNRAPPLADPLGRHRLRDRLGQVDGIRPGEDGQLALRLAARRPRPRWGCPGLRPQSEWDPDAPTAAPDHPGAGRDGLDRR